MGHPALESPRGYPRRQFSAVLCPELPLLPLCLALASLEFVRVAGALLGMGRGLAYLVDEGLGKRDPALLDRAVMATAMIAVVLAFGSYLRTSMVNKGCARGVGGRARAMWGHERTCAGGGCENTRNGGGGSRINTDAGRVHTGRTSTRSRAARKFRRLIGGRVMVVRSSAKMSLVVVIVVPLVVLPLIFMGRRLRAASRLAQDRLADVGVEAEETVSAIRTVQAFGREDYVKGHFERAVGLSLDAGLARVRLRGLLSGIVIFLVFSGIGVILWIGGQDLMAGRISAGDLSSFIFYAFLVASSTGFLSELAGDLQRAAGAAERIAQLLDTEASLPAPASPQPINMAAAIACEFAGIQFAYPAAVNRPAISDVSFAIKAGERVAIVGPSGAGKSTIFHLLLRFYDPVNGAVRVGGIDLRDLSLADLRGHIGLVPQDSALFSATLRENIAFGQPDADDAAIIAAAKQAQAHDFIMAIDGGYDAFVGEKGVRLSGGQRQRIAIARAILRNPRLLLLDEATSALDAQSEAAVQHALENLMADRTSLVIAHRLATIVRADRILLMDRGRLLAVGTHESLMVESALYRTLAELKFSIPKVG